MSFYENHYTKLRPALHHLSMHGTRVNVEGMRTLAVEWKARTVEIKHELDALTGGIPLYSIKKELSEEAQKATEVRRGALLASGISDQKARGLVKAPEVHALKKAVADTRRSIREDLRKTEDIILDLSELDSSMQTIKAYLKSLGCKLSTKKNKDTGKISETVDDVALKKVALAHPDLRPLTKLILEHRKCLKMSSTYCNVEKVDADNRIRCTLEATGTQTGRLASSENPLGSGLNQQNIPDHDEYGWRVKRLFLPDKGCLFLKFDLSWLRPEISSGERETPN